MKIGGLPRDPGPSGWEAILPPRTPGPALRERITADWLVIGSGFAGLAAARRLRQLHPGDRIVVLEARAIAEGPVARNSGFMIDLPHVLSSTTYSGDAADDQAQIAANRAAIAFAREAVEDYALPAETFDPMGKVNGAMTDAATAKSREYARHLDSLGEAYEFLGAKDMHDLTGSQVYTSGLYTPGTVTLQPALYARGIAQGLSKQNIEIFENSPALNLEQAGGSWLAGTPKGRVTAPRVILAVNGQIERFGHFQGRLMHIYLYASMTRPLSGEEAAAIGGAPKWGITPADPMGSTLRRIESPQGPRILIRNGITWDRALSGSDRPLARVARDHGRGIAKRWPRLAGIPPEFTWGGALCLSRTDTPAFGEVGPGLFAAACQNGLGTVHGTLSGLLAAELASGETSDLLTRQLALPQPTRLAPLSDLGAPAVLKWKEWQARKEM